MLAIPSESVSSPASRVRAGTSPDHPSPWALKPSGALELLRDTVPNLRSVAILSNPANPAHGLVIREVELAARGLGVRVRLLETQGPDDFEGAFAAMTNDRVGALYVVADVLFVLH